MVALSCGVVRSKLFACGTYLTTSTSKDNVAVAVAAAAAPPGDCCKGVRSLNELAQTTNDRQQACRCLKRLLPFLLNLNPNLVEALPGNCGIDIPYKITTSIDCNKVH